MSSSFLRKYLFGAIVCLFVFADSAHAGPVGVSYTVSGSSGAWVLDFSVTNNVTAGQGVYFFGILLPTQDILTSPAGSKNCALRCTTSIWNPSANGGGPNTTYNNIWINFDFPSGLAFGSTLSGFEVGVDTLSAPASVQWFAYSFDFSPAGSFPYLGGGEFNYGPLDFCMNNGFTSCLQEEEENPGFAGTAFASGATPEPSSLLLLGTGLLGFGPFIRRFARS